MMKAERTEQIENTHDGLRLFYTIILTIALSEGLLKFINNQGGRIRSVREFSVTEFSILFVFLLFMARFFLGGVRHLDAQYDETSLDDISVRGILSRYLGIRHFVGFDILLLSLDAILLLYVGSSIRLPNQFFAALTMLLINDAIWGLLIAYVYDIKTETSGPAPEVIWSINNAVFAVLFLGVFWIDPEWLLPILVGLAVLNSLVDFVFTWDFYFPF